MICWTGIPACLAFLPVWHSRGERVRQECPTYWALGAGPRALFERARIPLTSTPKSRPLSVHDGALSWPHAAERYYTIEGCTNLTGNSWFWIETTASSNYLETSEYDQIFYRLTVTEKN